MRIFLLLAFSLCSFDSIVATTVTATIDVGGGQSQPLCDGLIGDVNGEYDCKGSSANTSYADGWISEAIGSGPGTTFYNFMDPVPAGAKITNIEITLFNSICDATGYVEVEGSNVMFMLMGTTCEFDLPCGNNTTVSSTFPDGLSAADYNYGGMNNFDLMINPGLTSEEAICFTQADIVFTFDPKIVPTMGEWGVIILTFILLIMCTVVIRNQEIGFVQEVSD